MLWFREIPRTRRLIARTPTLTSAGSGVWIPKFARRLLTGSETLRSRKVRPHVSVDRELIGGLKILLGDKVIDGSARAQLAALEAALKA